MANKKAKLQTLVLKDLENEALRKKMTAAIKKSEIASVEAQMEFLNQLVNNEVQKKKFLENPEQYVNEHNMSFSLDFVQDVMDYVVFDGSMKSSLTKQVGEKAYEKLLSLKESTRRQSFVKPGVTMNLAAVAAFAAVVSAVASVVCAVTACNGFHPANVSRQGAAKIRMPDGKVFVAKDTGARINTIVTAEYKAGLRK